MRIERVINHLYYLDLLVLNYRLAMDQHLDLIFQIANPPVAAVRTCTCNAW
eukprot:COSAG02_NODE_501_length_21049_cov_34.002768_1_plen_51_part_00